MQQQVKKISRHLSSFNSCDGFMVSVEALTCHEFKFHFGLFSQCLLHILQNLLSALITKVKNIDTQQRIHTPIAQIVVGIAGALLYLKPEFHLESTPTLEGLVVASTFFGAAASVIVAGPAADRMGRKFVLLISGLLYSTAAMLMLWTPTVNILILSRVVVGLAIGLATTIAPVLISESAPTETRGQLATFPQLLGSSGLFFAYVMAFVLSLQDNPNWRSMLGVLAIPSFIYAILCLFALPESPRWLVSKGRMYDAKVVLQNLREEEDVSGLSIFPISVCNLLGHFWNDSVGSECTNVSDLKLGYLCFCSRACIVG